MLAVDLRVEPTIEENTTFVVRLRKVDFPQSYTETIIENTGLLNYFVRFDGLDKATEYEVLVTPVWKNTSGEVINIGSEWTGLYISHIC